VLVLLVGFHDLSRVTARERYAPGAKGLLGSGVKTLSALRNVFTDYLWTCPNRWVLRRAKVDAAWGYFFVHGPSYNVWPLFPGCAGLACHSYEVPFVFRRPYLFEQEPVFKGFTPQEQLLSVPVLGTLLRGQRSEPRRPAAVAAFRRHRAVHHEPVRARPKGPAHAGRERQFVTSGATATRPRSSRPPAPPLGDQEGGGRPESYNRMTREEPRDMGRPLVVGALELQHDIAGTG
jgi:hypothetical protein